METLEARVRELERENSRLRFELAVKEGRVHGRTNPELIEQMAGIFAENEMFDRMIANMETERQRERDAAEREAEQEAV
jgi:hypothetical protein